MSGNCNVTSRHCQKVYEMIAQVSQFWRIMHQATSFGQTVERGAEVDSFLLH
jgi:hypothetical protein